MALKLDGAGGDDKLYEGYGDARLLGNTGNDTLIAQNFIHSEDLSDDLFDGGAGTDTLVFAGNHYSTAKIATVGLAITGPQNTGFGMDTIVGIENLTGSAYAADRLTGNDSANVLDDGGRGLYEHAFDILKDTLIGGLGSDTYIVTDSVEVVIESSASGGTNLVKSRGSFALSANVENLTLLAEAGAAAATGNGLTNVIIGNASANILNGGGGADTMAGGLGSDTYVTDGGDILTEAANAGIDTVRSSKSHVLGDNFEPDPDRHRHQQRHRQRPPQHADRQRQRQHPQRPGRRRHHGRRRRQRPLLCRHLRRPRRRGERRGQRHRLCQRLLPARRRPGDRATDYHQHAGTSALNLTGNEFGNRLKGNAGDNSLNGGLGADTLYGLKGKDTFVFNTALSSANVDHLGDFSAADDTIKLAKSIFTALSSGTLSSGTFKDLSVAGATIDSNDRILYDKGVGALYYDADGSGATAAIRFAFVDTKATLTASDFFIVS